MDKPEKTFFYIVSFILLGIIISRSILLYAFIAPHPGDHKFRVTSMETAKSNGKSSTTFIRGNIVTINIGIEYATGYYNTQENKTTTEYHKPQKYTVFITIEDPEGNPVGMHTLSSTREPGGETQYSANQYLPTSLPLGECIYKVIILTDPLPGGEPLTEEVSEGKFELIR
jgi:hypothetical protein